MSTPTERFHLIEQLHKALDHLPSLTAEIIVDDTEGRTYELVRAFAIGSKTDDPGLVLKIREVDR